MAITAYPFTYSFDKDGSNGTSGINYEIVIDYNKTILKMGYNQEEELYEQLTFKGVYILEDEKKIVTLIYKEFTTSTGKVQKSFRLPDIITVDIPEKTESVHTYDEEGNIIDTQINIVQPAIPLFSMFDERYGKILRAHFANGLAEAAGLSYTIFDPLSHDLTV